MSWWAEIDVILGALCKQRGKRQTVTSGSHIIPTTWSMFAWACGGFGPGMHVWFHCMSTSFASRKGPNESCTFERVNFSSVLCLVECLSCWFCRKMAHFERDEPNKLGRYWPKVSRYHIQCFAKQIPPVVLAANTRGNTWHLTWRATSHCESWAEETLVQLMCNK